MPDTPDTAPTAPPDRSREPGQGLTKEEALHRLLEGHWRYLENSRLQRTVTAADRGLHAQGQYPFAALLGCADSRVAPELIFDQGQGDLFVVRVAGNIIGLSGLASLEYAVQNLGVRLIVVMGHENCGAVKAALDVHDAPGPIGYLLREIAPAVEVARTAPGPLLDRAVECNVKHTVNNILERSETLKKYVDDGQLRVVGIVYRLSSGDIEFHATAG
ncbi:carbonic anhydrase : Carbonic anhydrase OS=uncultured Desulfobacterium sp. GN=N47_A08030 PE=3 SV=1: Pro_CA [Gemmataceae bacterium]|nr:carbonic anhydrase : Carbonic anhydrase OS=uncultured Desulfobacterium sp. GN=N47_A08030 PE=3 SV=1: Pro_CA [Gemmataceae bacterium]VTU02049.1 carbonic anhydrase : Carbonic anhydrase OS=uncultured Desulfobacterium sp. GN=N47_A08030 PE=3 SV=1: Pro_CA [Gemmataceae bacterium]